MVGKLHSKRRYPLAFALTVLLFAVWGAAHRIFGIVSPKFATLFAFDYVQSSIVFLSLNISYILIAVPAALFLRRFGYKLGLVSGLGAFSLGALVLFPAVLQHQSAFYVASVVVTGIGWAFLEVSANTLIVRMGPAATAVRRLNLAQCFYPAGLIVVALFAQNFSVPQGAAAGQFADAIVRPYIMVGLAVLLLAIFIEHADFPKSASERLPRDSDIGSELKALLADQQFRNGAAVLAAYTTGIASLWSSTSRYTSHVLPVVPAGGLIAFSMTTWVLCAAGRVTGTALMGRIDPLRLLAAFAGCAVVLCIIPASVDSTMALGAMLAASFFISIMFPTIFAESIKNLGDSTRLGAGILVAASGLGGLAGTLAQRTLAGYAGFVHVSLAVAGLCFGLVLVYALAGLKRRTADAPKPSNALTPTDAASA